MLATISIKKKDNSETFTVLKIAYDQEIEGFKMFCVEESSGKLRTLGPSELANCKLNYRYLNT